MKLFLFLFGFFVFCKTVHASRLDGQEVCFDDLIRLMMDETKDEFSPSSVGSPVAYYGHTGFITIANCKIKFDRQKDNIWDIRFAKGSGKKIIIKKAIEFKHCEFPEDYWFVLRDFIFEGPVVFRANVNGRLYFRDCEFKQHFFLGGFENEFVSFERCQFKLGFQSTTSNIVKDHITFDHCKISYDLAYYKNPKVNPSQNQLGNLPILPPLFEVENRNNPFSFRLLNTSIEVDTNIKNMTVNFKNSSFVNLEMVHFQANVPIDLSFVTVSNQFNLKNFRSSKDILVESINFNFANSKLDWSFISGNKISIQSVSGEIYSGKNIEIIKEDYHFNTLISVYALLYAGYKSQGNRMAANACYVEWKTIETAYLKLKLTHEDNFEVYFSWLMNRFLHVFCDYGTNPIKAIYISVYVILIFAMIYFMFPNSENLLNEYSFFQSLQALTQYFLENKRISEIVSTQQTLNSSNLEFQRKIRKNYNILPWYLTVFAIFAQPKRKFDYQKTKWLRKIDRYAGRWNEIHQNRRRFMIKSLFFFLLCGSFLYVGMIRTLNAIMLSLNVFCTLGFGNVPVQGFAKYLTIIEGFVGWFLLSIFSVALISQIIQ